MKKEFKELIKMAYELAVKVDVMVDNKELSTKSDQVPEKMIQEMSRTTLIEDMMKTYGFQDLNFNTISIGLSEEVSLSGVLQKSQQLLGDLYEYAIDFEEGEVVWLDDFQTMMEVEITAKDWDEETDEISYSFKLGEGISDGHPGIVFKHKNYMDIEMLKFLVRDMELDMLRAF
jgi:hypothetical protein